MARTHRNLTAWSGAALAALLLAGCTSEAPSPPPTPAPTTESASPTPAPKAVVVAPARPAAMDDDGPAGADAAATYFLMYEPYMQMTNETGPWEAMSHEACAFCSARLQQANTIADNGYTFEGGVSAATVTHTYEQDHTTGIWPIDVDITRKPTIVTSSTGDPVLQEEGGTDKLRVEIIHSDDGWQVVNVAVQPAQ